MPLINKGLDSHCPDNAMDAQVIGLDYNSSKNQDYIVHNLRHQSSAREQQGTFIQGELAAILLKR
jgi:hypothetical protein